VNKPLKDEYQFQFEGTGFVVKGEMAKWASLDPHAFDLEVWVDGALMEHVKLPVSFTTRRHEVTWKYDLKSGKHDVKLKLTNPTTGYECKLADILIYQDKAIRVTDQKNYRLGNL
jgi:hypothetical protein